MQRIVISVDATVRKNERYGICRKPFPRIITSKAYKDFVALMAEEVRRLDITKVAVGCWRLSVWTTWPRLRHLDSDFPMGDSDASLSAVKDALQEAGVLDDDMRIIGDSTRNLFERDVRRVVAVLERVELDPLSPGEEYAALLAEVDAARQSPGYRQRTAEHLIAAKVGAAKKKRPRKKAAKKAAAKRAPAKPKRAPVRKQKAA